MCPLHSWNTLRWRHIGRDGVSNHQPYDCLLNRLFRRRSKTASKLRVTGLCVGIHRGPINSPHKWPVTRKMFPFHDVIMYNTKKSKLKMEATSTERLIGYVETCLILLNHCWQPKSRHYSVCFLYWKSHLVWTSPQYIYISINSEVE